MNTANLLNINVENQSAKAGKASFKNNDIAEKQGYSSDSIDAQQESKDAVDFKKALKESMASNQDSQNPDDRKNGSGDEKSTQGLPEDGKQLPNSENAGAEQSGQSQNVATGSGAENGETSHSTIDIEGSQSSEAQTSTLDPANDGEISTTVETGGVDAAAQGQSVSNLNVEQSSEAVDDGNVVEGSTVADGQHAATGETDTSHTISIDGQKNADSTDTDNGAVTADDSISQLDFIEQAQSTSTSVGVNSAAIKDSFHNMGAEGNKLTVQSVGVDSSSAYQSGSDAKSDSLFSGSMQNGSQGSSYGSSQGSLQDNGAKQQNFSQNFNFQNNFNVAANQQASSQVSGEFQQIVGELDGSATTEKLDTSKVTKAVTETTKPNPINDPLVRNMEVKTPVMTKGWNDEVNNQISYVAKNGGGNAKIKLNPAHLGPVEASIKMAGDGVTIQINANNTLTRDALDQGTSRLKEMLQEQGFSQVDVNVSDQGLSKGNRESTTAAVQSANHSTEGDLDGVEEEVHESSSTKSTINGVVDYYA